MPSKKSAAKQPKPPSAQQIFQQKQKILDQKEKLVMEEWRLAMMLNQLPPNTRVREKFIIKGDVYQLEAFNSSCAPATCEIARIGTVSEFQGLVCH